MMAKQQPDRLETHIAMSLAVHLVLAMIFTIKAYIFPSEPVDIRSAIRVDVVALPDKVESPSPVVQPKTERPPTPPKPEPKPEKKPVVKTEPKPKLKPSVDLAKTKSKQQQAMEKLQAMQALEKLKSEVAAQEKLQEPSKVEQPQPTEFKGNVVTSGSSLSGLDRIDFEKYYDEMSTHIKSHWSLPGWLASANLRAEAAVTIDEQGFVTGRRIYKTSGNPVFDDLVLQTVEKASPFPAPPVRLRSVLALKGMILAFPE